MDLNYLKPYISNKVNELGYELVSLSSRNEKGDLVVSIVVDRVEPIDMNAIVEVTNALNEVIDDVDKSNSPYFLDVSSLGAEKPLKVEQLKDYEGRYVNVHLINPINGENIYEGEMSKVNEDNFDLTYRIKTRVKTINILFNNIYKIRLAIKF